MTDTLITSDDLHLFNEGTHCRLYRKLGAHPGQSGGRPGTFFGVWAPDAVSVAVVGDFNGWDPDSHRLLPRDSSGIWEGFVPDVGKGALYKYRIVSRHKGHQVAKADPVGFFHEQTPGAASIVWDLDYGWEDGAWMEARGRLHGIDAPMAIYEVHLGSWMRPMDGREFFSYRELAPRLVDYLEETGFTHVELMPLTEHPFYGSWGYQVSGYFAPTNRYGTPQDFMFFVDYLHRHNIGVILDWVPSHFPSDEHGLGYFDGTHLYEHADPRKGFHPDWNSYIFNYGRSEVRSFLLSSAVLWLDRYHIDGLRVDAVASMLYLDYSREQGEWIPNQYGGRENLEAISFLKELNGTVYGNYPDVQMIAEESTDWPMVSRPAYVGGLGFGMKWDMGWMHDTLLYMSRESIHRKFHHNDITFRMLYAFNENFLLPLSHDEVVHGKGSLIARMPGDLWQKFANLRLLLGYMYAQPGKKLLFMGGEFGQWEEWDHDTGLDWDLLQFPTHAGVKKWVSDLNRLYRADSALHEGEFDHGCFEWIDCGDSEGSVLTLLRKASSSDRVMVVACNFTPVPRHHYRVGAPRGGSWREALNSDAAEYGGSGQGNMGAVKARHEPFHGRPYSLDLTLPPLGMVFLTHEEDS